MGTAAPVGEDFAHLVATVETLRGQRTRSKAEVMILPTRLPKMLEGVRNSASMKFSSKRNAKNAASGKQKNAKSGRKLTRSGAREKKKRKNDAGSKRRNDEKRRKNDAEK